jgi:hypothetical protein
LGIEVEVASVNNISRYGIVVFAKPSINFSVKMCAYYCMTDIYCGE